ncbi:JAB domain-containing protein [Brackiella oedipodis]|uniref:JAB domain-containing protein n=1 Tax=Brackiella oedipodis TaxID=124225 RepID=UPI0004900638|nr:JAB domain-containing protein [Brackiella oedipodis]
MNPSFLEVFNCSSNEELYKRLNQDRDVLVRYKHYDHSFENFYKSILNQDKLDGDLKIGHWLRKHNFKDLKQPCLLLMNALYKPVAKIDLVKSQEGWLSNEVKEKITNTPFIYRAAVHVSEQHIPEGFYLETFTTIHDEFTAAYEDFNFLGSYSSDKQNRIYVQPDDKLMIDSPNEMTLPKQYLEPEVFKASVPYLDGYHDFKHYLAEQKIVGLHIEKDSAKIEKILVDAYQTQPFETMNVMLLDKTGRVKNLERCTKGDVIKTPSNDNLIIKKALRDNISAFVLVHNHPDGWTQPSPDDIKITAKIVNMSKDINRPCIEHFIVGKDNVLSFRRENLIDHLPLFKDPSRDIEIE